MPKTERSAAARVARTGAPAPTRVPHNDWRQVDLPAAETFEPSQPVSVIVPYFEAPAALDLTLAALETQTYPRDLFEVIVVDDGSRPSLAPRSTSSLDPRFVRQPRRGFGLARARNTGARAAAHDILVFLDGDVLAEADMLKEHARWHHAVSDAVTVGFCNYVSTRGVDADRIRKRSGSLRALFADRPFDPSWTDEFLGVSDQMTATEHGIFRVVTGGNFGIGKAFYRSLGGFDETFVRYGSEDTEFGYRAFAHGGLLVPMPSHAWHQGRWSDNRSPAKERDLSIMRAKLVNHIPHPDFRPLAAGRIYAVPETVVTVTAGKLDARGRCVRSRRSSPTPNGTSWRGSRRRMPTPTSSPGSSSGFDRILGSRLPPPGLRSTNTRPRRSTSAYRPAPSSNAVWSGCCARGSATPSSPRRCSPTAARCRSSAAGPCTGRAAPGRRQRTSARRSRCVFAHRCSGTPWTASIAEVPGSVVPAWLADCSAKSAGFAHSGRDGGC